MCKRDSYNADSDSENPCGSIFCAKGAGFYVPFNEVPSYIHSENPRLNNSWIEVRLNLIQKNYIMLKNKYWKDKIYIV